LIRREVKVPKGSGGWPSSHLGSQARKRNGLEAKKTAEDRGEPVAVVEPNGRTGGEASWQAERSEQAGTFDPGMEASKGAAVAGEGKAVTSDRFGLREKAAACREGIDPRLEKPA
jgi:hypothetical protein